MHYLLFFSMFQIILIYLKNDWLLKYFTNHIHTCSVNWYMFHVKLRNKVVRHHSIRDNCLMTKTISVHRARGHGPVRGQKSRLV